MEIAYNQCKKCSQSIVELKKIKFQEVGSSEVGFLLRCRRLPNPTWGYQVSSAASPSVSAADRLRRHFY